MYSQDFIDGWNCAHYSQSIRQFRSEDARRGYYAYLQSNEGIPFGQAIEPEDLKPHNVHDQNSILKAMLQKCKKQFVFYGDQHIKEGTEESLKKAEINHNLAAEIGRALNTSK